MAVINIVEWVLSIIIYSYLNSMVSRKVSGISHLSPVKSWLLYWFYSLWQNLFLSLKILFPFFLVGVSAVSLKPSPPTANYSLSLSLSLSLTHTEACICILLVLFQHHVTTTSLITYMKWQITWRSHWLNC